jgi:hypothetical protein
VLCLFVLLFWVFGGDGPSPKTNRAPAKHICL